MGTEALSQGGRLVGFAYNALKEAFYSEYSSSLLLVDYDILAQAPDKTLSLIYQFLGEEPLLKIQTNPDTLNEQCFQRFMGRNLTDH